MEFSAYGAIALGTVWGGWKIIETMGLKITTLHASSGVAANIGAVTSIFGATGLGVPISTTHAAASSVAGAGVGSGMGINLKVVGEMVVAWIVTLPTTIVLAFGVFKVTQLPGALVLGRRPRVLVLVVAGLIVYAMRNATTAEDIEAEIPDENVLSIPVRRTRSSRATARRPEAPVTVDELAAWLRLDGPVCRFGARGPLRRELTDLVVAGTKTATAALLAEYEAEGDAVPTAGTRSAVIDDDEAVIGVLVTPGSSSGCSRR